MEEGLGDESGSGASGVFLFIFFSPVCIGFFFYACVLIALGDMRERDVMSIP
jgi:hypothetical protein